MHHLSIREGALEPVEAGRRAIHPPADSDILSFLDYLTPKFVGHVILLWHFTLNLQFILYSEKTRYAARSHVGYLSVTL